MLTAWRVTLTHPDLPSPLVMDLAASTGDAAARRARLAEMHRYRHAELLDAATEVEALRCDWFAGCDRPATGWTPHPVLGEVATCERCAGFAHPGRRIAGTGQPPAAAQDTPS